MVLVKMIDREWTSYRDYFSFKNCPKCGLSNSHTIYMCETHWNEFAGWRLNKESYLIWRKYFYDQNYEMAAKVMCMWADGEFDK